MSQQNDNITALDIKGLLNGDNEYVIPIYQRNYAWEAKEIEQLIQDIIDYSIHHKNKNYYIGTLVVAFEPNNAAYNTIDGQQRLTTLTILSSVIKNFYKSEDLDWFKKLNLHFASREKSMLSLTAVFNGVFEDKPYEVNIKTAYEICSRELDKKTKEYNITLKDFTDYFYTYVKILRVQLPDGIDLNHYFEIMNSRGEQLEKHEILKAKLMDCFNDSSERETYTACFDLIWEACSNMEKYVQYGFSVEQRHVIFGANDWNNLSLYNFDEFVNKLGHTLSNDSTNTKLTIDEILQQPTIALKKDETEDAPDRFNSVVNFQNFLLHVLRVQIGEDIVALDDKRLIELFERELPKQKDERMEFVKEYIYNLLKCKFLFDKYVIKREFTANTDRWSLKSLKRTTSGKVKNNVTYVNTFGDEQNDSFDSDNRRALMLLSMFHVSIPSMSYKYWLNASLNYLFNQTDVNSRDYIKYLEHIAKSFVFDRYLANDPLDYYQMVYLNLDPIKRTVEQLNLNKLHFGNIENNLVFNFCDYLLWTNYPNTEKDTRIKSFEYSFRSSVEHYYPQTPFSSDIVKIDAQYLHSFGNLCLISHEKNSRLNNFEPSAKKSFYNSSVTLDSIKQHLMMKQPQWTINEIESHNKEMIELFSENLSSDFKKHNEISLAHKWFKEYQIKDKVLLVRALLCFGDISKHINGPKYNLLAFDHILNHDSFKLFEEYIEQRSPKNLLEVINKHISYQSIKNDWRYLFIKYPQLINYCAEGNIHWYEEHNGQLIYLLETDRLTKNKSVEVYTYVLSLYLKNKFGFEFYVDYDRLYLNIILQDDQYVVIENNRDAEIQIEIWNNIGTSINYQLVSYANGNSKTIKYLNDYKWKKNDAGNFERFGNQKLINLGPNFEENIFNLTVEMDKLLKNGLGIK